MELVIHCHVLTEPRAHPSSLQADFTALVHVATLKIVCFYSFIKLLLSFLFFLIAGFTGTLCQYSIDANACNLGDRNATACQSWSSLGFCDFTYEYNRVPVPLYCPISCKQCNGRLCYDSLENCPVWACMGLCSLINAQNNGLCRKSCGGCH